MSSAVCTRCKTPLDERYCLANELRLPCPHCGGTARTVSVELQATCVSLVSLDLEGRRAGMSRKKGWFKRIRSAMVHQWNRGGAIAQHEREFDRTGDRYRETVTMRDTGEVVHHCDEPLSTHRGHGSDRRPRPDE
jgi:hypothetical protein